jgi:hypothetical protein
LLSYAIEDQLAAALVTRALGSDDHIVLEDNRLPTSAKPRGEIERQLREADVIVVLWSPHSARSDRVRFEATYAIEHDKLVAAQVQACEIPPTLCVVEAVNLAAWNGDTAGLELRQLADAIAGRARA